MYFQGDIIVSDENDLKSGSHLERVLRAGHFAVTAELGPPKSCDVEEIKRKAHHLRGKVDAVNITDNQTAIVRVSSLAAGVIAQQEGVEAVMQMTCRDRNRIAMQSDILGAYVLGLRNLLCLTGDHQQFGNHPTSKHVFDLDSIQLIHMVRLMRDEQKFLCGEEIRNSRNAPIVEPRMFIGAAENPFADPFEFRVIRLAKKVKAGADFIQTQCIYDMDRFREWMRQVRERGLHEQVYILAGLTPLKGVRMAKYMRDSVAGLSVPDYYIDRLQKAEDEAKARGLERKALSDAVAEEGIRICIEQIEQVREIEGIAGIHLMAIEWEEKVPQIVEAAGLLPRPE